MEKVENKNSVDEVKVNQIEKLRNDKEAMARLGRTCDVITNKFHDNWVSAYQLSKFLNINKQETYDFLMTLNIFGYVVERTNGKDFKYKITRTKDQKIQALRFAREMARKDLKEIEIEISKLESNGDV